MNSATPIRAGHYHPGPMILNLRTPISIELVHGQMRTACLARLVWERERLFAEPFKPDQSRQPWRWRRIELDPGLVAGPAWSVLGRRYRYDLPVPMG